MLKYVHAVQPPTVENNMERRIISHSSKGFCLGFGKEGE